MAIRNFKPTTNARRKMSTLINTEITASTPEKSLHEKFLDKVLVRGGTDDSADCFHSWFCFGY